MPLYIAQCGDLDRCYRCLTDSLIYSLTTLKDSATQLLSKYKSGALLTQIPILNWLTWKGPGRANEPSRGTNSVLVFNLDILNHNMVNSVY